MFSQYSEKEPSCFGSVVFLILTLLLTAYFPLRLAASCSFFTYILTIPTIVICVGCWSAFLESRLGQHSAIGLFLIQAGLLAQILFLLAEGITVTVVSFRSFGSFLGDIRWLLEYVDHITRYLLLFLLVCLAVALLGAVLCIALWRIRQGVLSAVKELTGRGAKRKKSVRRPQITRWVTAAAACCAVRLVFASAIHTLFSLLLYPYQTLAEGFVDQLFEPGGILRGIVDAVLGALESRASDTGSSLSRFKDLFLDSAAVNGMAVAAAVLFLLVLICVVVLLARMRKAHPAEE